MLDVVQVGSAPSSAQRAGSQWPVWGADPLTRWHPAQGRADVSRPRLQRRRNKTMIRGGRVQSTTARSRPNAEEGAETALLTPGWP